MSYLFKDSGYSGYDILVSTKKSEIQGVIVPYAVYHIQNGIKEKFSDYNIYTVHHSPEMEQLVTHISNGGFVNRFGLFFTEQEIPEGHANDVEIENGWFTRKTVKNYDEIKMILQSLLIK
jgi:hypothetical protein